MRNEDMAAYLDYVSRHHSPIHPGTAHSRCAGRVPELPTENEAENGPTERRRRTVQRDAVGDDCPWPRASRRLLVAGPEKVWRPIQRSVAHHFRVSRRDWLQANRQGALLSGPYCSVSLMLSRSAAARFSGSVLAAGAQPLRSTRRSPPCWRPRRRAWHEWEQSGEAELWESTAADGVPNY